MPGAKAGAAAPAAAPQPPVEPRNLHQDAVDREARTHVHTSAEKLLEAEELLSDTTAFLAAHCMLLLATAVHFTPTLKPYGHLLWLMRGIAVLLLACGSLRCVKFLHEATFCVSPIL